MGWQLVRHAIRMVVYNLSEALKAFLGPFAIALLLAGIIISLSGIPMQALAGQLPADPVAIGGPLFISLLGMVLIYLFVFAWVAVTWHRFILLEEYPGMIPAISGRPIWPYIGRSIVLGLLLLLVLIPVGLIVGLFVAPFAVVAPFVAGTLAGIILGAIGAYLWLRVALCLPAIAMGQDMAIAEAWSVSGRASGGIFSAALILLVINAALSLPTSLMTPTIITLIYDLAVAWFTLMVGVSMLTTLYGHLVQGRDLA